MICRAFFGHDSKYVLRERSARTAYATSVERPAVGGWLANKEYKDVTCIQSFFGRMRLKENSGMAESSLLVVVVILLRAIQKSFWLCHVDQTPKQSNAENARKTRACFCVASA